MGRLIFYVGRSKRSLRKGDVKSESKGSWGRSSGDAGGRTSAAAQACSEAGKGKHRLGTQDSQRGGVVRPRPQRLDPCTEGHAEPLEVFSSSGRTLSLSVGLLWPL